MLNRRQLLQTAAAAGGSLAGIRAAAAATRIDLYSASDANITDWLSNTLKPAFEKANSGFELNVVISRGSGGGGVVAIADRALAALQVKKDPQVDMIEEFDPNLPTGGIKSGLWTKFDTGALPNLDRLNPITINSPYGLPWRGSQVVLAYDSAQIPAAFVPKTWGALTDWIHLHPGQFIYGRPDRGGSGRNFVVRAIHEANGRDPSLFRVDNFSKALADERLGKAWKLLSDLAPYLYNKGAYTAGNTPTLQLLASGAVTMVPAWSDQSAQGIKLGVLAPTVKLVQLQDLALCGQFSQAVIPTNGAHHDGAMKLADMLLSDEIQAAIVKDLGGFPAVTWDRLPGDLKAQLADVVPKSIPTYPAGDWEAAMNDGWYRNVAPNIDRAAK